MRNIERNDEFWKVCTMKLRGFLSLMLGLAFIMPTAFAYTRTEVRNEYAQVCDWSEGMVYEVEPSVCAPYAAGSVETDVLSDALNYLNFLRWLAELEPVALSSQLTDIAQYGAVLSAANDLVSHEPLSPEDMPAVFYEKGRYAAQSSNIAKLNWMSADVLRESVAYFARDDGEGNLSTLGHRRWLLNPQMAFTGFGLANAQSGISYATMYAHDLQGKIEAWDYVAWPSAGAFPAEFMSGELAWSIILNPEKYVSENIWVKLTNLSTGKVYSFPGNEGYFNFDSGNYGAGPCIVFRPEVSEDYEQNQRWQVEAGGFSGEDISYVVEMISLYPVEVFSVEISQLQLTLSVGEAAKLGANAIPTWADDLSIDWESSNTEIASVSEGVVTAIGVGSCEIRAVALNGKQDVCTVTVQ